MVDTVNKVPPKDTASKIAMAGSFEGCRPWIDTRHQCERSFCKTVDQIFWCTTTPTNWIVSLLLFEPFGPITFGKSRRAAWLNYFIPVQVSRALSGKLANTVSNPDIFIPRQSSFFEWGSTSNPVCSNKTSMPNVFFIYASPRKVIKIHHFARQNLTCSPWSSVSKAKMSCKNLCLLQSQLTWV